MKKDRDITVKQMLIAWVFILLLINVVTIKTLHVYLQKLLISKRWFSTVCLSLLTLIYP